MRVINVIHRVRESSKESKAKSQDCLKEMGKIRKMKEGDISEQPSASRQIMTMHNLEQTITFGPQGFAKI